MQWASCRAAIRTCNHSAVGAVGASGSFGNRPAGERRRHLQRRRRRCVRHDRVLELARVLSTGRRPRRTVIFALFGSEEVGGLGAIHFSQHPPLPLRQIATQLEFEMIGRPDPAVADDDLWLTGWQRSNLGPVLAAHGAHLVADPIRSRTSSRAPTTMCSPRRVWWLKPLQATDCTRTTTSPLMIWRTSISKHINAAIGSLIRPIEWLVNSAFAPKWNEGGRP